MSLPSSKSDSQHWMPLSATVTTAARRTVRTERSTGSIIMSGASLESMESSGICGISGLGAGRGPCHHACSEALASTSLSDSSDSQLSV
eukprot:15438739-Alexandrium_andersonii.AAC.1